LHLAPMAASVESGIAIMMVGFVFFPFLPAIRS